MQPLQYYVRDPAAKDNSITHAAAAPSNLDAATTLRSAETELQNTIELRATASAIAAPKPDLDATAKKTTILKHFFTQGRNTCAAATTAAGPAAHTRYLSSPTAATLHWKTQAFVLLLPPQHTHPMQHSRSHYNAFRRITSQTCTDLRTWQHQMTTIMQPFHCDLQPQIQDTHRTTHTGTATTRCRGGTHSRQKRPQPHPPHTRGTFHRRPQPLYTEKHKLSCSCFLPNTSPMEHSRSHYNAFRRITSQTWTDLRTWQHQMTTIMQPFHCDLQPQIQDTHRTTHTGTTARCRGGTHSRLKTTAAAPAAHTRYLSSPAAATLHGKTQAFVLLLPPQHTPHATFMQPLQCVLPHHVANLHGSTHMATPDDNNHAAIPLRSATTDSRHA